MRKFSLFGLIGLFAVVSCFCGCSDDDDKDSGGDAGSGKASLVGTWVTPDSDEEYTYEMTFYEDGTFTDLEALSYVSYSSKAMGHGTYTVSGNTYTTSLYKETTWNETSQTWVDWKIYDEPVTDTYIFTIDGNKLTIREIDEEEDDVEIFIKK